MKLRLPLCVSAIGVVVVVSFQTPSAQFAGANGEMGGGGFDEVEAPGDPELTRPFGVAVGQAVGVLAARHPYTFYPHAGVQGWDLSISNYVDLNTTSYDITKPGLDFECTEYSYAGHSGHDSVIDGFREQSIGVPIFAALDGTVTAMDDGEFDENTTNLVGRPANFVTLSHTGGFSTNYYHMKRGSVAVSVGQRVTAGQQLGLTGSSGNSSWPHLHFTSLQNGTFFEPNAGRCRSGSSYWMNQPGINRNTWASSFTFGTAPFNGDDGYPYDQVVRRGTYVRGAGTIYFRMTLHSLPAQSSYRISLRRPDGSTALDNTGGFNNTNLGKHPWYWWSRNVTLNATGTWTLTIDINGRTVATAPFSVVDSSSGIVNRAPLALRSLDFDPANPTASDVPMCRVTPDSLYRRDPDYDLVRYRYRWFVRGQLVRDVTTAALADAIPAGTGNAGDELRCEVTPRDESVNGPTATLARTLR